MNRRELRDYFRKIRYDTSSFFSQFNQERRLETADKKLQLDPPFKDALSRKLSELPAGSRVLEVGIGKGYLSEDLRRAFPNLNFYGTNFFASSNPSRTRGVVNAEASQLPFRTTSFDFVFSLHCFQHVPDKLRFLRETHRVLKRGGSALVYPMLTTPKTSFDLIIRTSSGEGSVHQVLTANPQVKIHETGYRHPKIGYVRTYHMLELIKSRKSLQFPLRFLLSRSGHYEAGGLFVSVYRHLRE